jgi:hypothetical protein
MQDERAPADNMDSVVMSIVCFILFLLFYKGITETVKMQIKNPPIKAGLEKL